MKVSKLLKLIFARVWINFRKPLIEIEIENIYDRLANKIIDHELLKIFDMNIKDSAEYYKKYNNNIFNVQNGRWLKDFLGYAKNVPYWITPWGGCAKDHLQKGRLSLEHAKSYTSNLKITKNSIKNEGYIPQKYGYITGQILINEKGERRFIIWNGHRRILSLARLNYKKMTVEVSGGDRWDGTIGNHFININEVEKWKNVKNKIYSPEEAKMFFYKFFCSFCAFIISSL
jgi:hypothetical protein